MKKTILFIVSLFILLELGYSQNQFTGLKSDRSPNVASLCKYIETPVSYYTGIPNISIPLYSTSIRGIKMPISISYHASGIGVNEQPSSVGLGWSLNVGGYITRVKNGEIDERQQFFKGNPRRGYYYCLKTSRMSRSYWFKENRELNSENFLDTEPDSFAFNFMGYSGKFYLDSQGNWQIKSKDNLRLIFDKKNIVSSEVINYTIQIKGNYYMSDFINQFTIIDSKGVQYVFGSIDNLKQTDGIEFSESVSSSLGLSLMARTWYLSKIIDKSNNTNVIIEYERGPILINIDNTISYCGTKSDDQYKNWRMNGYYSYPLYIKQIKTNIGLNIKFNHSVSQEKLYSDSDYVQLFEKDNGIISANMNEVFIYSTLYKYKDIGGKSLSEIVKKEKLDEIVVNYNDRIIKKYKFNYSYEKRMLLKSLYEDNAGIKNSKYKFNYKDLDKLPDYLSEVGDHWGKCNGRKVYPFNNMRTIYDDILAIKVVDPKYTQAGVLNSIQYPTGAIEKYSYENNTYSSYVKAFDRSNVVKESGISGGLRIKKIEVFSITDELLSSKHFYYRNNFFKNGQESSGILNMKPQYGKIIHMNNGNYYYSLGASSLYPLYDEKVNTSTTYSNVIEEIKNNKISYYKSYIFSNHNELKYRDLPPVYKNFESCKIKPVYISNSDFRGLLLAKRVYNNEKHLVEETNNKYESFKRSNIEVRGINKEFFIGNPLLNSMSYTGLSILASAFAYKINMNLPRLISQETKIIEKDQILSKIANYKYNSYNQLCEKEEINPDGIKNKIKKTYLLDFKNQINLNDLNNPYAKMLNMGISGNVLEEIKLRDDKIINAIYYKYSNFNKIPRMGSTYVWQSKKNPYSKLIYEANKGFKFDPNYRKIFSYDNYNNFGNLTSYKNKYNVPFSIIWSYQGLYPIVILENCNYLGYKSELDKYLFQFLEKMYISNSKIKDLSILLKSKIPTSLIYSYNYIPFIGTTLEIGPNNISKEYLYDNFGRLSTIKLNDKTIKTYKYNYTNNVKL